MPTKKILIFIIVALILGYLGLQVFGRSETAYLVRAFILPLATIYYVLQKKRLKCSFFLFLLFYSIPEFLNVSSYFEFSFITGSILFYSANLLYIAAYLVLIFEVLKSWNYKIIFTDFLLHIILMLFLAAYGVYVISDVFNNILEDRAEFILVVAYNITIMLFLIIMYINYISKHTKSAMNLLLGAMCIFFSEIIQFASFYITETIFINISYFMFLILAFYFFFVQSYQFVKKKDEIVST